MRRFYEYIRGRGTTPLQLWHAGRIGDPHCSLRGHGNRSCYASQCVSSMYIEQTYYKFVALHARALSELGINYTFVDTAKWAASAQLPTEVKLAMVAGRHTSTHIQDAIHVCCHAIHAVVCDWAAHVCRRRCSLGECLTANLTTWTSTQARMCVEGVLLGCQSFQ